MTIPPFSGDTGHSLVIRRFRDSEANACVQILGDLKTRSQMSVWGNLVADQNLVPFDSDPCSDLLHSRSQGSFPHSASSLQSALDEVFHVRS